MPRGLDDFNALGESFHIARGRCPQALWSRVHRLAGWRARFDVVGAGLTRWIEPALACLAVADGTEAPLALRVDVWDERETGVPAPICCSGVWVSDDARVVVAGNESWVGAYDRAASHLAVAVRHHEQLSHDDRARPFARLLLIWYGDRGCQILHAGLVATPEGQGILIAGAGRSGKSTTVFACSQAGFIPLGDDCIALKQEDGRFLGFSLFSTLLVDPAHVRRFGATGLPTPDDPRQRRLIHIAPGGAVTAPVNAIIVPCRVAGNGSRLEPLSRAAALRALLPTALAMDPQGLGTRRGFETLAALLDRVPCYRLMAGADLGALPAVVRSALDGTGGV